MHRSGDARPVCVPVGPRPAGPRHARLAVVALVVLTLARWPFAGMEEAWATSASASSGGAHAGAVRETQSVSSGELVDDPQLWDGKTVLFRGEAITGAMVRGDHAWVHINDDAYQLHNVEEGAELGGYNSGHAVWMPARLAQRIGVYGDYTHEGDVVAVEGVFNAACGQHGGDMDIHAHTLEIEIPGHVVHEPVKPVKAWLAVALLVTACALWLLDRREVQRRLLGPRRVLR